MKLGVAFDNGSLRTKLGAAVLIAIFSGPGMSAVAITTVTRLNNQAEASQQQALTVQAAAGAFGKNVEGFRRNTSALQVYPDYKERIGEARKGNERAAGA
uniref:hypothetical protein n=1 Tax=Paractinoplanes polyasparticus TaxID=2856853 RepID=UPI001C86407E|nr:hypothetical protein [Actinoplanes polyasparticus]